MNVGVDSVGDKDSNRDDSSPVPRSASPVKSLTNFKQPRIRTKFGLLITSTNGSGILDEDRNVQIGNF
jgi:hypothetical protein